VRFTGYLRKEAQQLLGDRWGVAIALATPVLVVWVFSLLRLEEREYPSEFRETHPLSLVLCLAVWLSALTSTAYAFYRERQEGTLRRLSTTPYSPGLLLGSKMALHAVVGLVQVLLVWVTLRFLVDIRLEGEPAPLVLGLWMLSLSTSALGLLLSVTLGSGQQIANAVTLLTLVVVCLSGFLKPLADLDAAGQVAAVLPFTLAYRLLMAVLTGSAAPSLSWWLLPAETIALLGLALLRLVAVAPQRQVR
jgi:ABC-2 type transport system permease protein